MRVVLTGATGTIGRAVAGALLSAGDQVVAFSRDAGAGGGCSTSGAELHEWADPSASPAPAEALAGADAVVNLLGEPVAQRWSDSAKARIRDSRVLATRSLVQGLRVLPADDRPRTLISQSATGFYGARGDEPVDEHEPPGLTSSPRSSSPGSARRWPPRSWTRALS